jgi:hypothetical protein
LKFSSPSRSYVMAVTKKKVKSAAKKKSATVKKAVTKKK